MTVAETLLMIRNGDSALAMIAQLGDIARGLAGSR